MANNKIEGLTLKEKIFACHGNVNAISTARMCVVDILKVYSILPREGLKSTKSNQHRRWRM